MSVTTVHKGQHYELIKQRIDPVFSNMALSRIDALRNTPLRREPWMTSATRNRHELLASTNKQAWGFQSSVDMLLARLKDVYSFAEPLLKAKLREQYNVDVDVKNTCLRLYATKQTPWYVIDTFNRAHLANCFLTGCRPA